MPQEPYLQIKVAECILRQIASPESFVHKSVDATQGAALQARKHAAHAVRASNSAYARALWTLAASCVACAWTEKQQADKAVSAEALHVIQNGSLNSAASWSEYASARKSSGSHAAVSVPAALVAKDDNAALFHLAAQGLHTLLNAKDTTAKTSSSLDALEVQFSASNQDGATQGSWDDAAPLLKEWLVVISEK